MLAKITATPRIVTTGVTFSSRSTRACSDGEGNSVALQTE
jgi:hypothetical protein